MKKWRRTVCDYILQGDEPHGNRQQLSFDFFPEA